MTENAWIVPTRTDSPSAVSLAGAAGAQRLVEQIGTRRVSVAATTGAGKTFAVMRLLELLSQAGNPFVVIDPVGNFWGLRVAQDGKGPGLQVPVLGGAHGDLPLRPDAGRKVAELLARRPTSLVLDIARFDDVERAGFVTDFARRVLELWSDQRRVLTLVIDEAQEFLPETLERRADTPMRAVLKRIALTGRNLGLGLITLTQAPQLVLKRVFNLADLLLVGRLGGHHERKAVEQWVRQKGVLSKEALEDLPTLSPGTFFAWSPEWLSFFGQVKVTDRWTFDASKTPELGGIKVQEGALAPVDLSLIERELGAERTEVPADEEASEPLESDTEAHVRQLVELDQELDAARDRADKSEALVRHYQALLDEARHAYVELRRVFDDLRRLEEPLDQLESVLDQAESEMPPEPAAPAPAVSLPVRQALQSAPVQQAFQRALIPTSTRPLPHLVAHAFQKGQPVKVATGNYVGDLLATLSQYGAMNRTRLSFLSGKSKSSSTFASAIRTLLGEGLAVESAGELSCTPLGKRQAKTPPLPTGPALFAHYQSLLGEYDRVTFITVVQAGRKGLTRSEISTKTGHSKSSSTFADSVRRLLMMGLCEVRDGHVRLCDHVRKAMFG